MASQSGGWTGAVETLIAIALDEARLKDVPLLELALVDDQEIVLHRRVQTHPPRVVDTAGDALVFRVGSLSKLLTAVSILQAWERGQVDLDRPITDYCPRLAMRARAGGSAHVTLRQLLSHTAGIIRESPVGSYYDSTRPTPEQCALSMVGATLVYDPGTRVKYSNIGPTLAAYVVESVTGVPWDRRIEEGILRPLGMAHSRYTGGASTPAYMTDFEGAVFRAPVFDLGTAPSGNLYSTATDLARFTSCLFARGAAGAHRLLRPETLAEMWRVQLPGAGAPGFGLGFMVGEVDGRRCVSHGGAVYGFSSELAALVDDSLGVIVLSNLDCAGGVNGKIRAKALEALLTRRGLSPPVGAPVWGGPPPEVGVYMGRYRAPGKPAELHVRSGDGELYLVSHGTTKRLRRLALDVFETDDRIASGARLDFQRGPAGVAVEVSTAGFTYTRVDDAAEGSLDMSSLSRFSGDYGPHHAGLRVTVEGGGLVCRIEWLFRYEMRPAGRLEFAFPDYGMFEGERLDFVEDAHGSIIAADLSGVRFERRQV